MEDPNANPRNYYRDIIYGQVVLTDQQLDFIIAALRNLGVTSQSPKLFLQLNEADRTPAKWRGLKLKQINAIIKQALNTPDADRTKSFNTSNTCN
jgi:ABC-type uncharacterized transport system YnjBCD ATPase subunit